MASNTQSFHLILDFDGTIIKNNTIPLLDYLKQDQVDISYDSFLKPYLHDYTEYTKDYRPCRDLRVTLQEEYDYLNGLFNIEKRSIERIESSGWLKGLKWSPEDYSQFDNAVFDIRRHENLIWRAGFTDLVKTVWELDGIVDILSVNWSGNFIRAMLRQEFGEAIDTDRISVYSNEVDPSGTGHFSRVCWKTQDHFTNHWPHESEAGGSSRGIWTLQDKASIMQAIIVTSRAKNMAVVYAGDSKTDLKCINEADLGIRMIDHISPSTEQTSLEEVLDRLGLEQSPVEDVFLNKKSCKQVVYHASDFEIVRQVLSSWETVSSLS